MRRLTVVLAILLVACTGSRGPSSADRTICENASYAQTYFDNHVIGGPEQWQALLTAYRTVGSLAGSAQDTEVRDEATMIGSHATAMPIQGVTSDDLAASKRLADRCQQLGVGAPGLGGRSADGPLRSAWILAVMG